MYGGTATVTNSAMPGMTGSPVRMNASSPIPKQWWDQDPNASPDPNNNGGGPGPAAPQLGLGGSSQQHLQQQQQSNSQQQMYQQQQHHNNPPLPPGNIGNGMASSPEVGGGSAMDAAAANIERGYYRPGLRSPSPNIQQRLNAANGGGTPPAPQSTSPIAQGSFSRQNQYDHYDTTPNESHPHNVSQSQLPTTPTPKPPSANGLIRLSLKKPMGIVFEPMNDPHNPSQQRGVRICDLPRTGAAAISRQLEIGDELLSINNKTMSRLTFDEIMDFIIEADAENVDLLFRRPKKDNMEGEKDASAPGSAKEVKKDSVKWIDGNNGESNTQSIDLKEKQTESTDISREAPPPKRPSSSKGNSSSSRNNHGGSAEKYSSSRKSGRSIEEESILSGEETYYTQETEFTRENKRHHSSSSKKRSKRYANESFLDMLIDSICAPMMGDPTRDRKRRDDYDSDDDTYASYDDETLATYETASVVEKRRKKKDKDRERERERERKSRDRHNSSPSPENRRSRSPEKNRRSRSPEKRGSSRSPSKTQRSPSPEEKRKKSPPPKGRGRSSMRDVEKTGSGRKTSKSPSRAMSERMNGLNISRSQEEETMLVNEEPTHHDPFRTTQEPPTPMGQSADGSSKLSKQSEERSTLSPKADSVSEAEEEDAGLNTMSPQQMTPNHHSVHDSKSSSQMETQSRFEPQISAPVKVEDFVQDPNMPISELEYDVDNGADVSVMESVGGPSLLIESMRNTVPSPPPVSAAVMNQFGQDYRAELGLTREETIQLNPDKFYRFVVKGMLENNEPEKVRLLDKLFAKYKGREEHLIMKLNARYEEKKEEEIKEQEDGNNGFQNFGASSFSQQNGSGSNSNTNDSNQENDSNFDKNTNAWTDAGSTKKTMDDSQNMSASIGDASAGGSKSSGSEDSDYDSIDGSSPAVIAQVSELLNFVYGKTSVPGQIDRVSTIMRAYEGREAVLLELLETKALIKANADDNAENLPEYLRRTPASVNASPAPNHDDPGDPGFDLPDENISQSSAESPLQNNISRPSSAFTPQTMNSMKDTIQTPEARDADESFPRMDSEQSGKKKKKGMFGGIFKKKKSKKNKDGAFPVTGSKKGGLLQENDSI